MGLLLRAQSDSLHLLDMTTLPPSAPRRRLYALCATGLMLMAMATATTRLQKTRNTDGGDRNHTFPRRLFKSVAALYKEDRGFQISRDYKLVYIHVPKTGGSTIEESVLFNEKRLAGGFARSHHRIEDVMANATERRIENFTTATTIRHPCERFLSAFFYVKKKMDDAPKVQAFAQRFNMHKVNTVQEWVRMLDRTPRMWYQLKKKFNHFVPMEHWLVYSDGTFGIDVVMCQENWNEGIQRLFARLDRPIPRGVTGHRERTTDHLSCDSIDESTRNSIMRAYALDACLFGYGEFRIPGQGQQTCLGRLYDRDFFSRRYDACLDLLHTTSDAEG